MTKTGGRPSTVKEWMIHEDQIRRLYVDERKSLSQVIAIMQAEHGLTIETKRPLWNLFRKWKFPTRKSTATPIDDVVLARIRELWMQNVGHAELHRILTEEDGYIITKRALLQVRKKHKMLFRSPQGDRVDEDEFFENSSGNEDNVDDGGADGNDDAASDSEAANDAHTSRSHPPVPDNHLHQPHQSHPQPHPPAPVPLAPMVPEVFPTNPARVSPPVGKGHSKPRRLTRKHGIRPRDVTAPPRFPSELTLDESKAILGLEKDSYKAVRALFTQICEAAGVIKKTIAGPERWEAVKDDLIRRFPLLEAELWQSRDNLDRKKLALDVICCDTTKRMRVKEKHFALTQSRNILGLDPYETRQARVVFHAIVERHGVRSKTHAGAAKWNEIKNEWLAACPYIRRVMAEKPGDPPHEDKLKALERLAQDVMKRRWHDEARARRKDATRGASAGAISLDEPAVTPESGAAAVAQAQARFELAPLPGEVADGSSSSSSNSNSISTTRVGVGGGGGPSPAAATSSGTPQSQATPTIPSSGLVDVTASPLPGQGEVVLDPCLQTAPATQQPVQATVAATTTTTTTAPAAVAPGPPSSSMAIFLRPHESSTFATGASVWIGTMESRSLRELRRAAVDKYPGASCLRVEGILRDSRGAEMPLLIQGDAELEAYLVHLNEAPPTFAVQLVPGWGPT